MTSTVALTPAGVNLAIVAGCDVAITVSLTRAGGWSTPTATASIISAGAALTSPTWTVSDTDTGDVLTVNLSMTDAQTTALAALGTVFRWNLHVTEGTTTQAYCAGTLTVYPAGYEGPTTTGTTFDLTVGTATVSVAVSATGGPAGADGDWSTAQTINAQTDSYELVLGDAGKLVEMGKGTAQTLTVPTFATAAFAVGQRVDILQTGAGQVTVAGALGVTVNGTPTLKLRAQWSGATLVKRATNTWVLVGDLAAS